ncbi:MAG: hypothetical protein HUU28_11380 [Planctomycetaceae bacterium]|nr:hypothetical protein [Planctomycetaceae bacterium]
MSISTEAGGERSVILERRASGWRGLLPRLVSGSLLYLTLSGLVIWLAPFNVFSEHSVIVHTLVGLLTLPLIVWFSLRHVLGWWSFPLTHLKVTGWVSLALLVACAGSGLVLTWQGAFGTRSDAAWRWTHIATTVALLAFLIPHYFVPIARERRASAALASAAVRTALGGHLRLSVSACGVVLAVTAALCAIVRPTHHENAFPPDYDAAAYGDAGPFAPSLAKTSTGGAFDVRSFDDSASCGSSGCHEEIYREWLPSAHRYAAMDVAFQGIQNLMAQQNGATSTRYCAGCHDPISLFSGTKYIGVDDLTALAGYREGVSCLACHAIEQSDVAGNANYVIHQPRRYAWERKDGALASFLRDFVIRTYPEQHVASLSKRMFKTPEFCAACHKQFIDEQVNDVGWVQLQNQYDNWKNSRWNHPGDPTRTLECRECHMPLASSSDPASGDGADFNRSRTDGRHRSHRFLGANQFIPVVMELEGGVEHAQLVEHWLRGEYAIPEIADRWSKGPAVPIEILAPQRARAGEPLALRVRVLSNKVGHDFPTGPLDIIQSWIEVEVKDRQGQVVFHSGRRDERNFIEPATFMFKAEPVDRHGNLIDRHNLWEMVGVRFRRSLFPGAEEVARYEFACPGAQAPTMRDLPVTEELELHVPAESVGELTIEARLNYRKIDQYLLNFMYGDATRLTSPVTVVSEASARVELDP